MTEPTDLMKQLDRDFRKLFPDPIFTPKQMEEGGMTSERG